MRKFRQANFYSTFLTEEQVASVERFEESRPFSIVWEVRTLLYLGVLFLTGGLGILIYKNIDTIGHQAILAGIAALTAASLGCCAWKGAPFTSKQTIQASAWLDYLLLLGALLFGVFVGYLQFEYSVFGTRYGLAVGLPALFYLYLAYRFDHRGVLQLAISGIAATFGIVATPLSLIKEGLLEEHLPINAGLGVAAMLLLAGWLSEKLDYKRHFTFSYVNFAMHLGFIAALTGMFTHKGWGETAYSILAALLVFSFWKYARRLKSHYFLLITVLYGYVGFTYLCLHFLLHSIGESSLYLMFYYFLFSCAGAIAFFIKMKSFLGKSDVDLQEK